MKFYIKLTMLVIFILSLSLLLTKKENVQHKETEKVISSSSPKAGIKLKKARDDYFYKMLRDPITKKIPKNIRLKELNFAKKLSANNKSLQKTNALNWQEAGPNNVGGRTRALAVDVNNSNTIIAGGVSGGIWKSTDNGNTWVLKSSPSTILSVTSLAQDPRPGKTNIWYYTTGEFMGTSGTNAARFTGSGVYKSIDNGETWNVIASTESEDFTKWNSFFDYVLKVRVSPKTGSVFLATNGQGIFRSTDEGNNFTQVLGGTNEHFSCDISIAENGNMVVVLSSPFQGVTPSNNPGVYKSNDDGNTWTNITPTSFPANHLRSVVEIAPSNNDIAYVYTFTGQVDQNKNEIIKFHKLKISDGSSEDRSSNLPSFQFFDNFEGVKTQQGYNMTLAVKPDDENFVLIAGTSLFRSTNGFATKPNDPKLDWIGGYHPRYFNYPNFHSDIHSFYFDPKNSNAVWWGHDGGLSYTSNISNTNYQELFPWENKNNGYNVTQFYHISISKNADDNRIMGGTQDNGTPFFRYSNNVSNEIEDVSTGDGSYSHFGNKFPYVSAQNGAVMRINYDNNNNVTRGGTNWSNITPKDATNQLFISPFTINPNNEDIMFYPAGNKLWRNNQLTTLPANPTFAQGTNQGWNNLSNLSLPEGFTITALCFSDNNPVNRLYFGGSDLTQNANQSPKIFKLDNANIATDGAIEISISNLPINSYLNNIVVNPNNADEIIAIYSNYGIKGIFYSNNGGQTFTSIEGNLEGDDNNPGPSIRDATILPTAQGVTYYLATSIGIFSTNNINGDNTIWDSEGKNILGNVIVNSITSRTSDGRIVAGTHGRGAFAATANSGQGTNAIAEVSEQTLTLRSSPGNTGTTSFELHNKGTANLNFNISVGSNSGSNKRLNDTYYLNTSNKRKGNNLFLKLNNADKQSSKIVFANVKTTNNYIVPDGNDFLSLDDGNNSPDDFVGLQDGSDFYWYNEFQVSNINFEMDSFIFFMRTENAITNKVELGVYDGEGNELSTGTLDLTLSKDGDWYKINLTPSLNFSDGDIFIIQIGSKSGINYPAGTDKNAKIKNKSFYYNWFDTKYYNLNSVTGFENGAFLIRAVGTFKNSSNNSNPTAIANLSKTNANVNEAITFDASQSSDSDGNIVSYLWNFGDGNTSTDKTANHSYSQTNTYQYKLTVTDDKGAKGETSGVITVTNPLNTAITVSPQSGIIAPGQKETITVTLNAQTLAEGNYKGNVNINSNGGNISIPINYLVPVEKTDNLPENFELSQNYPNPFNPTTTISYTIPINLNNRTSNVVLRVYDVLGKEVATLVNEKQNPGNYKVSFNANELSNGVYFYKLEFGSFTQINKMVLLK